MTEIITIENIKNNIKLAYNYYKNNNKVPLFNYNYYSEHDDIIEVLEKSFNKKLLLLVNDQFLTVDHQLYLINKFINSKYINDDLLNVVISYNIFMEWCYEIYSSGKNLVVTNNSCQVSTDICEPIEICDILDTNIKNEMTKLLLNNKFVSDNIQRLFTDLYLILITKNIGPSIKILVLFVLINIYKSFYCFNIKSISNDLIDNLKNIDGVSFGFYGDFLIRINIDKDKINLQYIHHYYFQKFDKLKMISILGTLKARTNNQSDHAFISIYFNHRYTPMYKQYAIDKHMFYDVDKDTKLINTTMVNFIKLNIDFEQFKEVVFRELSEISEDNYIEKNRIRDNFTEATKIFIQNVSNLDFSLRNIIQDENYNNVNSSLQKLHKESIQNFNEFNNLSVNTSPIFNIDRLGNNMEIDGLGNNIEIDMSPLMGMLNIIRNVALNGGIINRDNNTGIVFNIEVGNNRNNNIDNDTSIDDVINEETTEETTDLINELTNEVVQEEINTDTLVNETIINNTNNITNNRNILNNEVLVNTAIDNDREVVHDHKVICGVVNLIKMVSPPIHNKSITDIINELDELPIETNKGVKICVGILRSIVKQNERLFIYDFGGNGLNVCDAIKLVYMRTDNQSLINAVLSCLTNLYLVIEKSMEIELYGVINQVKNTMIEDEILNLIYRCEHIEVDFNLCCATGQFIKILSTIEGSTIKLSTGEDYEVPFLSSDTVLKNEILFILSKMVNDYDNEEELYKNAKPLIKKKYSHLDPKIIDDLFESFNF